MLARKRYFFAFTKNETRLLVILYHKYIVDFIPQNKKDSDKIENLRHHCYKSQICFVGEIWSITTVSVITR